MCIPLPKSWKFEKDLGFTFDLWRLQTPLYNDTQGRTDIKTRENHGKEVFFFFFLIFIFNCKVLTYNTYLQTMYDTYATNRTILYYTERKLLYNVWMHFSPTLCQKYMNINVVKSDLLPA